MGDDKRILEWMSGWLYLPPAEINSNQIAEIGLNQEELSEDTVLSDSQFQELNRIPNFDMPTMFSMRPSS